MTDDTTPASTGGDEGGAEGDVGGGGTVAAGSESQPYLGCW